MLGICYLQKYHVSEVENRIDITYVIPIFLIMMSLTSINENIYLRNIHLFWFYTIICCYYLSFGRLVSIFIHLAKWIFFA